MIHAILWLLSVTILAEFLFQLCCLISPRDTLPIDTRKARVNILQLLSLFAVLFILYDCNVI